MEGTAIVISPLIALMKNQVDLVRGYSQNDKVAHFLNSSLSKSQANIVVEDVLSGVTKLLYVAPETLSKKTTTELLKKTKVSFVAVDEAHCISEWGHDFRPEYRRIREMIDLVDPAIPIIALTATATPKVQGDIVKTLKLKKPKIYIDSFNRPNLFYEVRPKRKKKDTLIEIVQYIKSKSGKSGIVYCLNRKTTEVVAEELKANGINAAPYHAGLDSKARSKAQDDFLMEDVDVICATIAFGMGIDKPDIRFVIHYDIPKSLENYYQETGRGGRDGLEGNCLAFFSQADVSKLEKFMRDKSLKEREIGGQHLLEVVGYSETSACRREFLLHYFGEAYKADDCSKDKMCDNCRNPKEKRDVTKEMTLALKVIDQLNESFGIKYLVDFLVGTKSQDILQFRHEKKSLFGKGNKEDAHFWNSVIRHAQLKNLLVKDIENYGILKLSGKGKTFIESPKPFHLALNHDFKASLADAQSYGNNKTQALDQNLYLILKDLRKQVAKDKGVPPFVVFQDPSLEDMATLYPITIDELANISGVSKGKANKYGKPFLEEIKQYVEENDIERIDHFVMKQVADKSKNKVYIIQNVDKKIPLENIASNRGVTLQDLIEEIETIVSSGTKLNLDYHISNVLDGEQQEEIFDYFMEAENDSLQDAIAELNDSEFEDYTFEDIRLMRIKFMSEMAN